MEPCFFCAFISKFYLKLKALKAAESHQALKYAVREMRRSESF